MKRPFLAVDDYGMGGIWLYIDARSPEEIERVYPELKVFPEPPDFLMPDQLERIESELHFDIDEPPRDYLAELVEARERGAQ
jgi:hypothetical protein